MSMLGGDREVLDAAQFHADSRNSWTKGKVDD